MLIYSVVMAGQGTYATIVGELTATFGYSNIDITIFGICFIIGGISGSIFFGWVLGKYKTYKLVQVIILVLSTLGPTLFYFLIGKAWQMIAFICILLGFGMISISVVCFELGVE